MRGRKALPEDEKRTSPVLVYFTAGEREELSVKAKQQRVSLSSLLRELALRWLGQD